MRKLILAAAAALPLAMVPDAKAGELCFGGCFQIKIRCPIAMKCWKAPCEPCCDPGAGNGGAPWYGYWPNGGNGMNAVPNPYPFWPSPGDYSAALGYAYAAPRPVAYPASGYQAYYYQPAGYYYGQ